ncbi:MAG: hypothetical protein JWN89_446 [Parcubacteria group bacterium]|nr:hypothetical protein [Parcubacteria group bacterium]
MSTHTLKVVGRWVAVLPTAGLTYVLGGMLANVFFSLQQWLTGVGPDSGWAKINYWIFSSAISAAACVYYGSRVAPSHKKIVSMILAALVVVISTFSLLISIINQLNLVWTILAAVSSIIAAGVVMYGFFEEDTSYVV